MLTLISGLFFAMFIKQKKKEEKKKKKKKEKKKSYLQENDKYNK